MLRWLSRFSFTLLIIGGLCFYQAYLSTSGRGPRLENWKVTLLVLGGMAAFSLGLRGIKERHRRQE